ncbi:proline iminopeptidase-like [Pyrus x bretschneideri]|uniref:proline iminopeptidase-like n=1 Tax=Pyrus x bretschneideri TaxID=225117 RepID=UPI00202FE950|nr:proline iminopeptidase-like [Pyrus x bretschneideri]
MARWNLYPNIEPYNSGFLKVSDIHTIYWEQSGNPDGHPVVFLHGGPGGGTSPSNRRFFDPEFYRIILFDQRGAGQSTPHACLVENTTWDLISDIEKLREHLEIPEWQVFGGSWGSTLALVYSQSHPDKVTGIVLRGIFLLRKKEIDWFYEGGAAAIYPDNLLALNDYCTILTIALNI